MAFTSYLVLITPALRRLGMVINALVRALTSGQRQLISFAHALIADPKIIVSDEATSNIDTATEQLIQRAIKRLLKGRTALVIAHRLSTIKEADLVVVLKEG